MEMAKAMLIDSDEEVIPETSSDEEGDKAHFTPYTKNDAGPTALVGCMPTSSGQVNAAGALDMAQRKSLAPAWSVVTAAASTLKDMLDPRTSSITLKVLSLRPPPSLPPSLPPLATSYIDTRFLHFTE
jgi:hypothetical protein